MRLKLQPIEYKLYFYACAIFGFYESPTFAKPFILVLVNPLDC